MRSVSLRRAALVACAGTAAAHSPPLLPPKEVAALANELSGEIAKRNLEGLARLHRQRGSQRLHSAAELVAEWARAYGLSEVQILQFPADGRTYYGTQRSRQAWDAEQGDLAEVRDGVEHTLASYEAEPVALAEASESGDVTADLVDVGQGTQESDYSGKDTRGKLVLVSAQPAEVEEAAIGSSRRQVYGLVGRGRKSGPLGTPRVLLRKPYLRLHGLPEDCAGSTGSGSSGRLRLKGLRHFLTPGRN